MLLHSPGIYYVILGAEDLTVGARIGSVMHCSEQFTNIKFLFFNTNNIGILERDFDRIVYLHPLQQNHAEEV